MRFTDIFIHRPVLATVVSLLILLLGASPVLSILAGPITRFTDASATQLLDQSAYSEAILSPNVTGGDS